jgi:hypothetical protein
MGAGHVASLLNQRQALTAIASRRDHHALISE